MTPQRYYKSRTYVGSGDWKIMKEAEEAHRTRRYEQLKAKIAEACPDLGTYHDPHAGRFVEIGNSGCGFYEGADVLNPITIAHVLRTLGKVKHNEWAVNHIGEFLEYCIGDSFHHHEEVLFGLAIDLDGQSDEVKKWLCDVILRHSNTLI